MSKKEVKIIIDIVTPLLLVKARSNNKTVGKIICVVNEELKGIELSDVWCKKNNRGYGTLMMKELFEFAKQNQYRYIEGWLSKNDMDHAERLYRFYKKFGFEIVSNDDGMKFADIKVYLK